MNQAVISVEKVSKAFAIGEATKRPDSLAGSVASFLKSPVQQLHQIRQLDTRRFRDDSDVKDTDNVYWGLKNVSFKVNEGDAIGILGPNGAGKSTLLKILSRITFPTLGNAKLKGRVGSLLEVGTGFHPELTGRENIYMNGTVLGMRKREIDRKLDEIIDFSGVEKFIETPTKRWSSGMRVRLAFAVAAHLEPEILIVDEVLAVGDVSFQKKCLGKMESVAGEGRTILFVSHNMSAIRLLCKSAILLENGVLADIGSAESVIEKHLGQQFDMARDISVADRRDRYGSGLAKLVAVEVSGQKSKSIFSGQSMSIRCTLEKKSTSANPDRISIQCHNNDGVKVWDIDTAADLERSALKGLTSAVEIEIPRTCLATGKYTLSVAVHEGIDFYDYVGHATSFEIEAGDFHQVGRPANDRGGSIHLQYSVRKIE